MLRQELWESLEDGFRGDRGMKVKVLRRQYRARLHEHLAIEGVKES